MSVIGSYLDVVFEVSSNRINTFTGLSRTSEIRYDKLDVEHQKPIIDKKGMETEPFTFTVKLSKSLGVDPLTELAKWRVAQLQYKAGNLVIGKKNYSSTHPLIIKRLTDEHTEFDKNGDVSSITLSVELMEDPVKKSPPKAAVKSSIAPANKGQTGTVTVTTHSIHIRAGAGTNHKALGYGMKGQQFPVYGIVNGWYDLGNGKYMSANSKYSSFKGVT